MPYQGRMRTALLNDRQIRPIEYRRWADAHRRFQRREKDRQTVDAYKDAIRAGRRIEPIHLGISDRYPDVYVRDGHHRAVAHLELGAKDFPFIWSWIRSIGVRVETRPFPFELIK